METGNNCLDTKTNRKIKILKILETYLFIVYRLENTNKNIGKSFKTNPTKYNLKRTELLSTATNNI